MAVAETLPVELSDPSAVRLESCDRVRVPTGVAVWKALTE